MTPIERVARTIRDHALLAPGDRVALAVSGGPDSVALAWLVNDLVAAGRLRFGIAGLIHVNHGLRDEADADEAFVVDLAARLEWPCEVGRVDVAAFARAARRSREAAAREVRYRYLEEAAARLGATRIATGHTADDQAETVLLRLLRGAGGRGLSGIRYRRGPIVRPLLDCRRAALREELARRGEPFREDASNLDESIARNRVRHRLLPVVEQIAPGGIEALARAAALAADDEAVLERLVNEAASAGVLEEGPEGVALDEAGMAGLEPALARRLVRRAAEAAGGAGRLTAAHLERVWRLAAGQGGAGPVALPGCSAERRNGRVLIRPGVPEPPAPAGGSGREWRLDVPGAAEAGELGVVLTARREAAAPGWLAGGRGAREVALDAASVAAPLTVRTRRPGDRFRPLGAPGRRTLQDFLVDRKVPRGERDRVPVVADARGRIVWVVGQAIAHECRVGPGAEGVVILRATGRS